MKNKGFILFASISCATLVALGLAAATNSMLKYGAFATQQDRNPYIRSLTISASNFQNGSGTFTLEGTQFAYEGVTVEGNNVSFSPNGFFKTVEDSGSVKGSDLTGAGYTTLDAIMTANYSGDIVLNGNNEAVNLTSGNTHNFVVNDNSFNFVIKADGFKVSAFVANYKCQSSDIIIDGVANDYIWSSKVMSRHESIFLNDSYKTEVYAYKNSDGIYIYAEQHVAELKDQGAGWWLKDNIELHIDSGTAYRNDTMEHTTQYYVSMNGEHSFSQAAHSTPVLNPSTNLYDIRYEAFVTWAKLGLQYQDIQIMVGGSNYQGGFTWSVSNITFHSERSHRYHIITGDGIRDWSLDYLSGNELITETKSGSAPEGWNYRTAQVRVSTSSNFMFKIQGHFENDSTHLNDLGAGFVGEFVSSNGWDEGGCSFRKDWNGWGGFAPDTATNPNKFDIDEISTAAWDDGACAAFQEASNAMDITVVYSFRGSVIDLMVKGVSTYEGHVGQTYYMSMRFKDVSSLANIDIGVGYNLGSASITSYQTVIGTATLL